MWLGHHFQGQKVKGQRSRSPGRFTHCGLNASGSCSGERWNVLGVGNYCYVEVCSAALGASAPTEGGEGRGISWRPPAYSLFQLYIICYPALRRLLLKWLIDWLIDWLTDWLIIENLKDDLARRECHWTYILLCAWWGGNFLSSATTKPCVHLQHLAHPLISSRRF